MKASFGHLHINVRDRKKSFAFYKDLLTLFGYKVWHEGKEGMGIGNEDTDFWFEESATKYKKVGYHRKRIGVNHISFRVASKRQVNDFVKKFLVPRKIKPLYGSPKAWPEYSKNYYAVYFEDPDRIKIEVSSS